MVLEIRISNFFSIKDEVVLDLRAAALKSSDGTLLEDHTFKFGDTRVLKSVAIYGANASGKSNLIKAIRFCHAMVYQSHTHNENTTFAFEPFKFDGYSEKPSTYFIRFINKGVEYAYSFSLTKTEVVTESLYFFPKGRQKKIFTRDERLGKTKKEKYSFGTMIRRPMDVAENTSKKTLYISRASQMDREVAKDVFVYFAHKFVLDYLDTVPAVFFSKYRSRLLELLHAVDSDIKDFKVEKEVSSSIVQNNQVLTPFKLTTYHQKNPEVPFDFKLEESYGTQNFFFRMLTLLDVVENDKILLVDEIGDGLHPSIVDFILEFFYRESRKAQWIFTTHYTKLLALDKLRKDQIYFTNKKEGATELYSLYDFDDFREDMNVEDAYLQGRFDAVPFIDVFGYLKNVK